MARNPERKSSHNRARFTSFDRAWLAVFQHHHRWAQRHIFSDKMTVSPCSNTAVYIPPESYHPSLPDWATKKQVWKGNSHSGFVMMHIDEEGVLQCLEGIKNDYSDFLKERNEQGQFKHRKLRSALRSLTTNSTLLYTYKRHPKLKIPSTTNSCDGSFTHWKNKVKIHRGLKQNRKQKMIQFLLANS